MGRASRESRLAVTGQIRYTYAPCTRGRNSSSRSILPQKPPDLRPPRAGVPWRAGAFLAALLFFVGPSCRDGLIRADQPDDSDDIGRLTAVSSLPAEGTYSPGTSRS